MTWQTVIKQYMASGASGGLGAQPPASPWSERSEGTDVRRSAEGAGEGRSPKRSEGLWACGGDGLSNPRSPELRPMLTYITFSFRRTSEDSHTYMIFIMALGLIPVRSREVGVGVERGRPRAAVREL